MSISCNGMAAILLGLALGFCSVNTALAQSNPDGEATITITSAAGLAGTEVAVQVEFSHTGSTQALTVDMEFDPSFFSDVDLSDCTELIEATQNAADCFVRNAPNDNQIRINLINVPTPADIVDGPFGTMRFTIDPAASPGDTTTISVIDVVLEGDPDLVFNASTIEALSRPPSELSVTPAAIDFGAVFLGETSTESLVSICNEGEESPIAAEDLSISSVGIAGAAFAEGAGGSCPGTSFILEAGTCCSYSVVFSPTVEGAVSGSLNVTSDAGVVLSDSASLAGEGIAPPVELVFVQSPDYGVINGPLYGGVVVHVLDSSGNLFSDDSATVVEISLANDPSGLAVVSGTTEVTVVGGVAVFSDLSIDQVGSGFELRASDQAGDLDSGDSDAFAVLPLELLQDRFENLD